MLDAIAVSLGTSVANLIFRELASRPILLSELWALTLPRLESGVLDEAAQQVPVRARRLMAPVEGRLRPDPVLAEQVALARRHTARLLVIGRWWSRCVGFPAASTAASAVRSGGPYADDAGSTRPAVDPASQLARGFGIPFPPTVFRVWVERPELLALLHQLQQLVGRDGLDPRARALAGGVDDTLTSWPKGPLSPGAEVDPDVKDLLQLFAAVQIPRVHLIAVWLEQQLTESFDG